MKKLDAFIEKQCGALDKFIRTNTSTSRNPDELALAIVQVELYEVHNILRNYWIKLILILSSPTSHLKMLEETFEPGELALAIVCPWNYMRSKISQKIIG